MKEKNRFVKKVKKPWPTKKAMQQVYDKNLWGDNGTPFYSGDGSHLPELVKPYVSMVSSFLSSFKNPLDVCDLGCGDFHIGQQLFSHTNKYIGVDIVPELIAHNKDTFQDSRLEFHCLNIAKQTLPTADCVMLRQVLQHLSNAEILRILPKLYNYKYLILTEHLPQEDFTPNLDIISGQGIRIKKKSGVDVLAAPFNLKVTEIYQANEVLLKNGEGRICTSIYKLLSE